MENKIFERLPIIETERLRLRNFRVEDAEEYFYYHSICEISDGYDWRPDTVSEAEEDINATIEDYKTMESIRWAIVEKGNDKIIGDCGIITDGYKGEFNYMLSKLFWGKGIMTETLNAVASVCFEETNLQRLQALTLPENQPSNNLLKRLGYTKEGTLRKYGYNTVTGKLVDLNMWSLLREEYCNYADCKILFYTKF
jgi:ribosomal-protein-alanine N-acetyltransferase